MELFYLNKAIIMCCGYLCVYIKPDFSMYWGNFFTILRIVMSLG